MKNIITRYNPQEDEALLPYIREIADQRGSYGYRRITTLVNHRLRKESKNTVNHKRVYRIMKLHKLLLPAYGKKSARIHDGKIITLHENESVYIPIGGVHRLSNPGKEPLEVVEVQTGDYLEEDDIVRYEDIYARV